MLLMDHWQQKGECNFQFLTDRLGIVHTFSLSIHSSLQNISQNVFNLQKFVSIHLIYFYCINYSHLQCLLSVYKWQNRQYTIIKLTPGGIPSSPKLSPPHTCKFMKCLSLQVPVKETTCLFFPDIMPSPKGLLSFFLLSFFCLLRNQRLCIVIKFEVDQLQMWGMGRMVKFKCWQLFFKAKNTESSAAKSALDICWGEEAAQLLSTKPIGGSSLYLAP